MLYPNVLKNTKTNFILIKRVSQWGLTCLLDLSIYNDINRLTREMLPKIGRETTIEELATRLKLKKEKIQQEVLQLVKEPISTQIPVDSAISPGRFSGSEVSFS